MDGLFLKLLNMSISASWLVFAVLIARFLLRGAPKGIRCVLWALVGIRLVCPVSFESILSLIPSAQTIPAEIVYARQPAIDTGVEVVNRAVNPAIAASFAPPDTLTSVNPIQIWLFIAGNIWVLGMAAMVLYGLVSYLRLRRRTAASICLKDNIWLCDYIDTPFILGIFRPRIYLPSGMKPADMIHVLAHERAHLKRKDHWWKPIGFAIATVYWFNPLVWLAYVLLCRDIELACDEQVIRDLGAVEKKGYSEALLSCSMPRRLIAVCPLAFGEVGVKQRIKTVLHYKKPAFWLVLGAIATCCVIAVCFLTDPVAQEPEEPSGIFTGSEEDPAGEYYLTIGTEGVTEIRVSTPASSGGCRNADGTPFEKGEKVWLEQLSGMESMAGVEIIAVDQKGDTVFSVVASADNGDMVASVVRGSGWSLLRPGYGESAFTRQVSCAQGYANITLCLPDGWGYEKISEASNFGIVFWPEADPAGTVKLAFYPDGFGVCGTGLETKEKPLSDGLTGTFGYYDGNDQWSYMIYQDAPGAYVVQRENTENWWETYEDEVMGILGSAQLGAGIVRESEAVAAAQAVFSREFAWGMGSFDHTAGLWNVRLFAKLHDSGPTAEIQVDTEGNVVEPSQWGVSLSVTDVTPAGLRLQLTQSGGTYRGELQTGAYYSLERWNGEAWEEVPVAFDGEFAWTMEAQLIWPDTELNWDLDWGWLYGELPAGTYRVGKDVSDFVSPEDNKNKMFYAQFEISSIEEMFDTVIPGQPVAGNPYDRLEAHPEEYALLKSYGTATLRYCYGEFLKGGQEDMRGYAMAIVCKEIIGGEAVKSDWFTLPAQQWFDAYLDHVLNLRIRISEAEIKAHYPMAWVLYEMVKDETA